MCAMRARRHVAGAVLIEVCFMIAIVGMTVAAIVQFVAVSTNTTARVSEFNAAIVLAENVLEWTGVAGEASVQQWLSDPPPAGTPVDVMGDPITCVLAGDLSEWRQSITARRVSGSDLKTTSTSPTDPIIEVTVSISRRKEDGVYVPICSLSRLHCPPPIGS